MRLEEIVRSLELQVCAGAEHLDREVTGGYACDLLSYVMAKAKEGNLWLTIQGHANIVAVASLVGLSGVIVTEGAKIEPDTLQKAGQHEVVILTTPLPTYVVAGRLYELGVRA